MRTVYISSTLVHSFIISGSDGKFSFWDKDARTKLKTSEDMGLSITSCCFNSQGTIFAYATGYDWAKVLNKGQ